MKVRTFINPFLDILVTYVVSFDIFPKCTKKQELKFIQKRFEQTKRENRKKHERPLATISISNHKEEFSVLKLKRNSCGNDVHLKWSRLCNPDKLDQKIRFNLNRII